jgi:hypothetical protein
MNKKNLYLLLIILLIIFTQNLFAKQGKVVKDLVDNVIKQELSIEFYYSGMFEKGSLVLRKNPLYKEQVLKYPYKHKTVEFNDYKNEFIKLKDIKLRELKPDKIQGLEFLVIFLKNKENGIIYTIEIGEDIGINDRRYKFNEEFKEIISRIIPEYYGEEWKEEYNNYMKKTNKN